MIEIRDMSFAHEDGVCRIWSMQRNNQSNRDIRQLLNHETTTAQSRWVDVADYAYGYASTEQRASGSILNCGAGSGSKCCSGYSVIIASVICPTAAQKIPERGKIPTA
jgi:hypothetical protein